MMDTRSVKGFIVLIASLVFLLGAMPLEAQAASKVAIIPFSLLAAQSDSANGDVEKTIAKELEKSSHVELIPKEQMAATLAKYGNYSDENAKAIAAALGADFLLVGAVLKFGEEMSLDAKVWLAKDQIFVPIKPIQGRGLALFNLAVVTSFKDSFLFAAGLEIRVANIAIAGNAKIGTPAIMRNIRVIKGKAYSADEVSKDIKAIFGMGFFDDVAANVTKSDVGTSILYTVREKPLVKDINISGNDKIDDKQIRSLVSAKLLDVLNPGQLAKDVEKIKQFYRSKGYYNTDVKTSFKSDNNSVIINMDVYEGSKLYITNLHFRGNAAFPDEALFDVIKTREKHLFSFITERGILKEEELQQDVARIEGFYAENGFISAKAAAPQISYTEKGIEITIGIQEGYRVRVGKIEIGGDKLKTDTQTLLKNMKANKKGFVDRSAVVSDREYLQRAAQDEGYANAMVTLGYDLNETAQTMNLLYNISTGPAIRFNRILVAGHAITDEDVILRELAFSEGELYSRSKMESSHRALNDLGYFGEVTIQTDVVKNNTVDVAIQVKEKETGVLSFGVGYSASENAAATAQISKGNLFGRGQNINLQGTISGKSAKFNISFVEPYLFDYNIWSRFELWNMLANYDKYTLDSRGTAITLARKFPYGISGSLSYRFALNNVADVASDAAQSIKDQNGTQITSSVGINIAKDTTDSYIFPTRGYNANFYITYAGIGGDIKFNKYTAFVRNYSPITSNLVFSLLGTMGFVEALGSKPLPTYEKFSLGGIGSLTGLTEIGPRDPATNDLLGGKTMMYYNAEMIFPIVKDAGLMGALFYNMGNAWDSGYNFNDMRHTTGLGIRWNSPIGPIRLECGFPIDRQGDEPTYRMEFSLGMRL